MNKLRITAIFISIVAAAVLASYGHDTQRMDLWAIGLMWIVIVMLAQLWPEKKKRHRKSGDTQSNQLNRSTDYAEAQ